MKSVTLDLKADKSFAMNMLFQFGGDWTFNSGDGTLTLNMTKMGNMDVTKMPGYKSSSRKPMIFKLSDDNTQLTMQPDSAATNSTTSTTPVVFEKS